MSTLNDPGSTYTGGEQNQSVTGRLGLNHVARTGPKSFTHQRIAILLILRGRQYGKAHFIKNKITDHLILTIFDTKLQFTIQYN